MKDYDMQQNFYNNNQLISMKDYCQRTAVAYYKIVTANERLWHTNEIFLIKQTRCYE